MINRFKRVCRNLLDWFFEDIPSEFRWLYLVLISGCLSSSVLILLGAALAAKGLILAILGIPDVGMCECPGLSP